MDEDFVQALRSRNVDVLTVADVGLLHRSHEVSSATTIWDCYAALSTEMTERVIPDRRTAIAVPSASH